MRQFLQPIVFAALAQTGAHAADAPAPAVDAAFGAWTLDKSLTAQASASASTTSTTDTPAAAQHPPHGAGGRHGGGGMGGGGMSGGHGGGHHGGHSGASAPSPRASADDAEQGERGLARAFAAQVTITPQARRIRFDDGEHAIELDEDGGNISGAGIGGTVALTATSPDLVVETLTDSGYSLRERYHLGDDGKHLELHASLKRPDEQPREIVRVFDRAKAADASTSAPTITPAK